MQNRSRRTRLIKPELQTQAIFVSLAVAKCAVALTCAVTYLSLRGALADHPGLLERLPRVLAVASLVAMAMITPVLLAYVTYATHRVAGPAHRIEQYLKGYLRGEKQGRLTLREKDELQVLANLLDMALSNNSSARTAPGQAAGEAPSPELSLDPASVPGLALDPGRATEAASEAPHGDAESSDFAA